MSEEESKAYKSCPSGTHFTQHIPVNDYGDELYDAARSVVLNPDNARIRENLANAANRYNAAKQATYIAWLRINGKIK